MILATIRRRLADAIAPELMEQRNALERAANVDELTGLANRRALNLALASAEADPATSIVIFDADNFGKLNKAAGHRFGDVVLKEMAAAIRTAAARHGFGERVFRYGGDEFVCLCSAFLANRIRDDAEAAFGRRFPAFGVGITGTIGPTLEAADALLQARKLARKQSK